MAKTYWNKKSATQLKFKEKETISGFMVVSSYSLVFLGSIQGPEGGRGSYLEQIGSQKCEKLQTPLKKNQ